MGQRLAANTAGQLFQTYSRDTGEIVNDISVPVYLGPEHWGAVRIGLDYARFQAATEQGRPAPIDRAAGRRVCGIAPLSPFLGLSRKGQAS